MAKVNYQKWQKSTSKKMAKVKLSKKKTKNQEEMTVNINKKWKKNNKKQVKNIKVITKISKIEKKITKNSENQQKKIAENNRGKKVVK